MDSGFFQTFFYQSTEPMLAMERDSWRILEANAAACLLYGYSQVEFCGLNLAAISAEPQVSLDSVRSGETSVPFRLHRKKDGTIFPVEILGSFFEWEGRRILIDAVRDITGRYQEEFALRENQERWELASQAVNEGVWDWDFRTQKVSRSRKWYELFGYEPGELADTSWSWENLIHPDDLAAVMAERRAHIDGEKDQYCSEHRVRCKDGQYRWFLSRGRAVRNAQGELVRMLGFYSNIEETVRNRERILAQSQALSLLHEVSMKVISNSDTDVILTFLLQRTSVAFEADKAYLTVLDSKTDVMRIHSSFGITGPTLSVIGRGQHLIGQVWEAGEPMVIDDYDAWPFRVQKREADNQKTAVGYPLKAGNEVLGVITLAYLHPHPPTEEDLNLLGQFCSIGALVIANANAQARIKDELEKQKAQNFVLSRQAQIIDQTHEGLVVVDLEGKIMTWNRAAERLFGYPADEVIGLPISGLHAPEEGKRLQKAIAQIRAQGYLEMEMEGIRRGGEQFPLQLYCSLLRDENGGEYGFAAYILDISGRRQVERKLETVTVQMQRSEFLNSLTFGGFASRDEAVGRGRSVGISFKNPFFFMAGKTDRPGPQEWSVPPEEMVAAGHPFAVWERRGTVYVMCPVDKACSDVKHFSLEMAARFKTMLETPDPTLTASVGVGTVCRDVLEASRTASEAREALEAGARLDVPGMVHHYLDVGFAQMLARMEPREQITRFVQNTIGRLLSYDRDRQTKLVPTLEKILAGRSLRTVSEELGIHHKTLLFRKERIEAILNLSLEDPENRVNLSIALKLNRLTAAEKKPVVGRIEREERRTEP